MVRLRDFQPYLDNIHDLYFNSNMVRLRENDGFKTVEEFLFQFQYGAIKRRQYNFVPAEIVYFNSNMVRLRVKALRPTIAKNIFQFQYGAIKSFKDWVLNGEDVNFNSNMVRLREKFI